MAESRAFARRVFLADPREDGSYLRVTWHPEQRAFVLSHWRDEVCLAATHLDAPDAAPLLSLLGNGLADAAVTPPVAAAPAPPARHSWAVRLTAAIAHWRRASDGNVVSFPGQPTARIDDQPQWKSGS